MRLYFKLTFRLFFNLREYQQKKSSNLEWFESGLMSARHLPFATRSYTISLLWHHQTPSRPQFRFSDFGAPQVTFRRACASCLQIMELLTHSRQRTRPLCTNVPTPTSSKPLRDLWHVSMGTRPQLTLPTPSVTAPSFIPSRPVLPWERWWMSGPRKAKRPRVKSWDFLTISTTRSLLCATCINTDFQMGRFVQTPSSCSPKKYPKSWSPKFISAHMFSQWWRQASSTATARSWASPRCRVKLVPLAPCTVPWRQAPSAPLSPPATWALKAARDGQGVRWWRFLWVVRW